MKTFALLVLFFASNSAFAGHQGTFSFTAQEKADHASSIQTVVNTASACLDADLAKHKKIYSQYGVSPFYGDRSAFSKLSSQEKLALLNDTFLQKGYRPADAAKLAQQFLNMIEPTSCVGLVLKCLGNGFKAAGQADLWARLRAYTDLNGDDGTALQHGLRDLGWRVLYWNPWTQYNEQWDATEQANDPENKNHFWGYHAYRWASVQRSNTYYWNIVDDKTTLVDFGTNVPASFRQVPFFVGTAHTGYHVFPGHYGQVVEGHSTRAVTDSQTIETAPFNPLSDGGAPRGQYFSGLVAVPPGY